MFKVLTGSLMNLVGTGKPYGATPSGPVVLVDASADAAFPLAKLYDGVPASPFRLGAPTTGCSIRFANNRVANGDMEQGTAGWTASGATLTSETAGGYYHKGLKSLKVVSTEHLTGGYKDVTAQAGEYLQLWAAIRSDGSNPAMVQVRCLDTMKDLSSAGAWSAIGTMAMTRTAATMAAITPVTFQAPSYSELGKATVTLRIFLLGDVGGHTSYFDEVLLIPGIDFVGLFGHGFEAATGVALAYSDANYWHTPSYAGSWFGDPANGLCRSQVAILVNGSRIYDPFPAVRFYPGAAYGTYASQVAPWIGELVVGQAPDLNQNPDYPFSVEVREPNVRFASSGGSQWILPRGGQPLRRVTMSFAYATDADYQQARDVVYGMSRGGAFPLVLVPTETDAGTAIYGRLEDSTTFRRDAFSMRSAEFIVQEDALPWF